MGNGKWKRIFRSAPSVDWHTRRARAQNQSEEKRDLVSCRQQNIGDWIRLPDAFVERTLRVCKNHGHRVSNVHSIRIAMFKHTRILLKSRFSIEKRTQFRTVGPLMSWQWRDSMFTVAPHWSFRLLNRIEWQQRRNRVTWHITRHVTRHKALDSKSTVAPHWSFGLLSRIEWHNTVEIESRDLAQGTWLSRCERFYYNGFFQLNMLFLTCASWAWSILIRRQCLEKIRTRGSFFWFTRWQYEGQADQSGVYFPRAKTNKDKNGFISVNASPSTLTQCGWIVQESKETKMEKNVFYFVKIFFHQNCPGRPGSFSVRKRSLFRLSSLTSKAETNYRESVFFFHLIHVRSQKEIEEPGEPSESSESSEPSEPSPQNEKNRTQNPVSLRSNRCTRVRPRVETLAKSAQSWDTCRSVGGAGVNV